MAISKRWLGILLAAVVAFIYMNCKCDKAVNPVGTDKLRLDEFWGLGPKSAYTENDSIKSFKIEYGNTTMAEIQRKLNETYPLLDQLEGVVNEYGMNKKVLLEAANFWRDDYLQRWSERQQFLNQFPQFKTEIQGLNIHFIHMKQKNTNGKRVVPLLLLHGWPGSLREFYDFIPLLMSHQKDSDIILEVVAPSLPGFGFSDAASKVGLGPAEIAVVLRNLMLRLGHEKFIIQGGDWGSIIGTNLVTLFPEEVIGFHSNFCFLKTPRSLFKYFLGGFAPSLVVDKEFEHFLYPMSQKISELIEATGYFHLQATKPDTVGAMLSNNPFGLLAFFYEKFNSVYPKIPKDALIDNVMFYYLTNKAQSGARLYAESVTHRSRALGIESMSTPVPTGCARFLKEFGHTTDWQLRDKFTNLIHSTWYNTSSHFAALETPELLYSDLRQFLAKLFKE